MSYSHNASVSNNSNTTNTSSSNTDQSNDGGWLKIRNIFGQNDSQLTTAKLQPGFVPMKSDFNIPTDGLPATTIKSRKAGRSIR